jgi:hypothetical protein
VRNVTVNDQTLYAPQTTTGGHAKSPAQICKAELKTIGRTAFVHTYGKNHTLRNAMGKCVSMRAKKHHTS